MLQAQGLSERGVLQQGMHMVLPHACFRVLVDSHVSRAKSWPPDKTSRPKTGQEMIARANCLTNAHALTSKEVAILQRKSNIPVSITSTRQFSAQMPVTYLQVLSKQ